MIKLKSIIENILAESSKIGNYEQHTIETKGVYIPALIYPDDSLHIGLNIRYHLDGRRGILDITDASILFIDKYERDGEHRFDMRLLHPNQLEELNRIVKDYVRKHEKILEQEIIDNIKMESEMG